MFQKGKFIETCALTWEASKRLQSQNDDVRYSTFKYWTQMQPSTPLSWQWSKCRKTSVVWIHTNLQNILAFWITLAGSMCSVRVIWQCSGVLSIHVGFPLPSSVAVQRPYQENFDIDSTRKCIQRLGRGRACTCCGCLLAQGPTGLITSMYINLLRTVLWRWKLYFHELWQ
jgi:hypothetical protein